VARLRHPNIVPILDVGEFGGILYYTMPLIDGASLRTVLRNLRRVRRGAPPEPAAPGPPDVEAARPPRPAPAAAFLLEGEPSYWKAVARIGVQVARALAHAHEQEILHRDIKPSNLLLDAVGVVYVTDFGLAKATEHNDLTETDDLMGTLRFMAPERFHRWCDPRSDCYSLGLTLYELLARRPAFDSLDRSRLIQAISCELPPRPRALDRDIPRALETIVWKAMEKEPGHRYQSARALADDLQRFLDDQPILARPLDPARRAWRWARRNKALTAALVLAVVVVLALVVAGFVFEKIRADAAQVRAHAAQVRRDAAEAAVRDRRFDSLLLRIQQIRMLPHSNGWSQDAWDLVCEAARIRIDDALRDQAAATLMGLDARLAQRFHTWGATAVAFDHAGRRILLGGHAPAQGQDGRARLWNLATNQVDASEHAGPSPVTFAADGTPVQLVVSDRGSLLLWDLAHQRAAAWVEIPGGNQPKCLAMTADGSWVAVATLHASQKEKVFLWNVISGQLLPPWEARATALAFSPDSSLLAVGGDDGRIRVWSMTSRTLVAQLEQERSTIHGLCFARDPRRNADGGQGWLLAAGDAGGSVVIWDLAKEAKRSQCHGSTYHVFALAFSPDGALLASGGRGDTRLWDVMSGRLMLSLNSGDHIKGLAFSPDGRRLAVGCEPSEYSSGLAFLWDLDTERGIRSLRGLTAPVGRVRFSPESRWVAAHSHDWRVALWDRATGHLRSVWEAPKGFSADNTALAFDADGRRLAAAAGRQAQVWDTESGRQLHAWNLPAGMVDQMSFDSAGKLLLFRVETSDDARSPQDSDFQVYPRICRIRDLLGRGPDAPVAEIPEFNRHVYTAVAAPDGRFFVVEGDHEGTDGNRRMILALDGHTGQVLWSRGLTKRARYGVLATDPTGAILTFHPDDDQGAMLVEMPWGQPLRTCRRMPACVGPEAALWIQSNPASPSGRNCGYSLLRGDQSRLVNLGIDFQPQLGVSTFNRDGSRLAWGNPDGTVIVCDMKEIQRRLTEVGLGW
jgi:WD40 repeat protein